MPQGIKFIYAKGNQMSQSLLNGSSCVLTIPPLMRKAAILYDKVFEWPDEVMSNLVFEKLDNNIRMHISNWRPPTELTFTGDEKDQELINEAFYALLFPKNKVEAVARFYNTFAKVANRHKGNVDILLPSQWDNVVHDSSKDKCSHLFTATLKRVPIITNNHSWKEIVEFRKDEDSVNKLRNLRCWLREAASATSSGEAEDKIGKKLYEYETTIKGWGFKTVKGTIAQVVNSDAASTGGLTYTAANYFGGQLWAIITGGTILGGRAVMHVTDEFHNLQRVKNGDTCEVAVLHDINKKFGNNKHISEMCTPLEFIEMMGTDNLVDQISDLVKSLKSNR